MSLLLNTILLTSLVGTPVISDNAETVTSSINALNTKSLLPSSNLTGYNVLKILLEDEQYLTGIRRAKMIITFGDISDSSRILIDDISNTSEQAINELKKLAEEKPFITFDDLQDTSLAKSTLDSLRMTTAKEFLFDGENFEKNLLLSQLKVLRLISHLAIQLEKIEPSAKRKLWLNELSSQYETFYQQVNSRFTIQASN